ncbi:MAG: hypothetical protein AAFU71_09335 [Cyanobacteria bacterium J06632_22]
MPFNTWHTLKLLILSLLSLANSVVSWGLLIGLHTLAYQQERLTRYLLIEIAIVVGLVVLQVSVFSSLQRQVLGHLAPIPDRWLRSTMQGAISGVVLPVLVGSLISTARANFYDYLGMGWFLAWTFSGFWSGLRIGRHSKRKTTPYRLFCAASCSFSQLCWSLSGLLLCLILIGLPEGLPELSILSSIFLMAVIVLPSIVATGLYNAVLKN